MLEAVGDHEFVDEVEHTGLVEEQIVQRDTA